MNPRNVFPRVRPRSAAIFLGAIGSISLHAQGVEVTGRALAINGRETIPDGLFGVHAFAVDGPTAEEWGIEAVRLIHPQPRGNPTVIGPKGSQPRELSVVVDCFYDRYVPALQLTDPAWKHTLGKLAVDYGEAAKSTGQQHYLEFWNEPYLNWATKPAVNYAAPFFRTEGVKSGDPMVSNVTGEPVEGLEWDKEIFFVGRGKAKHPDFVLSGYIPRDGKEGETVTMGYGAGKVLLKDGGTVRIRNGDHTLLKLWSGRDPGQKYYWSGPVNLRLYNEMLGIFGPALKETNPGVKLAAGWGFNFFNENWAVWEQLIKPTIDSNHPWIDALHEHHYGGDTRMVPVSYEVAYAYTLGKYGKRLEFWNTEAGGHLDPQQPGVAKPSNEGTPLTKAVSAMTYLLRDVLYILHKTPDKGIMRAAHHPQTNAGDKPAFQLLKSLRGRLMQTASSRADVWPVASLEGKVLSLAIFNDSNETLEIPVLVKAPEGTRFMEGTERRAMRLPDAEGGQAPVEVVDSPVAAAGAEWKSSVALDRKSAVVFCFELDSEPRDLATVMLEQFVSPEVLVPLGEKGATFQVNLPGEALAGARAAFLRLPMGSASGEVDVTLNGRSLFKGKAGPALWDIPVQVADLSRENRLEIRAPDSPGAKVLAASLWLEKLRAR